jgi:L-fuconolactonase
MVDSHVHLWNPAQFRYAWLDSLPDLNRAFLPADFFAASAGAKVEKFIFVECGCEPTHSVAEAGWVSDLAAREPRLKGVVARAALEKGEAVRPELATLASCPLVKGVRRNLQSERDLEFCLRTKFVTGIKLLAEFRFTFDVCIRPEQLPAVAELARRVPQVTFVLDHLGKPDVRGKQMKLWAVNLKALAALPNVACKISGLATEADWGTWQPDDLKFYFGHALECFGFGRLLFGGDWPVATLAASYQRWLETVQQFFSFAPEAGQTQLFQTNAERLYRV